MGLEYNGARHPQALSVTLPFPPSLNNLYNTVMKGRKPVRVLGKRAVGYRADCLLALNGVPKVDWGDSRVVIEISLYPPDERKRDVDNYGKSLIDALVCHGYLPDDSRVVKVSIEMLDVVRGGKAIARAAPVDPEHLPRSWRKR